MHLFVCVWTAAGSSTKYAHIDITATETAQRVGAQHAQGREERLQELEQKRRGTLTWKYDEVDSKRLRSH